MERQRENIEEITPRSNIQDIIKEHEFIECPICTNNFDLVNRIPMIPCRECPNVVCGICLAQKVQKHRREGNFNKCYYCPLELIPETFLKSTLLINFIEMNQKKIKTKQAQYINSYQKLENHYANHYTNQIVGLLNQIEKERAQHLTQKVQNQQLRKKLYQFQLSTIYLKQKIEKLEKQNEELSKQKIKLKLEKSNGRFNQNVEILSERIFSERNQKKQSLNKKKYNEKKQELMSEISQLKNDDSKNKELKKKGDDLFNQAVKQFDLNNLDQALKLLKECQQVQKLYPGRQTVQYANTIHKIANIEYYKHNSDQALKLYEQSLMIKQKTVGKTNQDYANTLSNIGGIYQIKGDLNKAMNCYQQVLKIKQATVGKQHQSYAQTLQNIGFVYNDKKEHEKALMNYQIAKKIYQRRIGKNCFNYASVMNNIGVTYQNLGEYKTALGYYSQCVQIMIKTNNQKHPYFQQMKKDLQRMKTKLNSK